MRNRILKTYLSDWGSWSSCSTTCGNGIQTRTRTCAYDPGNFAQPLSEQKSCFLHECCNDTWTSWGSYGSCYDAGAGPYKQRKSRSRFVQSPGCTLEGKSVQYDYYTTDCSYRGDWGTGNYWICFSNLTIYTGHYCGRELANMILNAANGCRRYGAVS